MPEPVVANVTIVSVSSWPTQAGKARWKVMTADGREMGCWDKNLADAASAHLHEDLLAEISTKQDQRDPNKWWTTLVALPALGVRAADTRANSGNPGTPQGGSPAFDPAQVDRGILAIERAALALENLLAFVTDAFLKGTIGPSGTDDGPQAP